MIVKREIKKPTRKLRYTFIGVIFLASFIGIAVHSFALAQSNKENALIGITISPIVTLKPTATPTPVVSPISPTPTVSLTVTPTPIAATTITKTPTNGGPGSEDQTKTSAAQNNNAITSGTNLDLTNTIYPYVQTNIDRVPSFSYVIPKLDSRIYFSLLAASSLLGATGLWLLVYEFLPGRNKMELSKFKVRVVNEGSYLTDDLS